MIEQYVAPGHAGGHGTVQYDPPPSKVHVPSAQSFGLLHYAPTMPGGGPASGMPLPLPPAAPPPAPASCWPWAHEAKEAKPAKAAARRPPASMARTALVWPMRGSLHAPGTSRERQKKDAPGSSAGQVKDKGFARRASNA